MSAVECPSHVTRNPLADRLRQVSSGFIDGNGKLMTLVLTPGQRHESTQLPALMEHGAVKRPGRGRPRLDQYNRQVLAVGLADARFGDADAHAGHGMQVAGLRHRQIDSHEIVGLR